MNAILNQPFALAEATVGLDANTPGYELVNHLLVQLRHMLHGSDGLAEAFYELLPEMLELKLAILKASLERDQAFQPLESTAEDVRLLDDFLAQHQQDTQWAVLVESAGFAVRTMARVALHVQLRIAENMPTGAALLKSDDEILQASYDRFWNRYVKNAGPAEARLVSASLMLELCLMAIVDMINRPGLGNVAPGKMPELITLTNSTAQTYGAAAIKMGIIPTKRRKVLVTTKPPHAEDLASDQSLAELGMAEYFKNLE